MFINPIEFLINQLTISICHICNDEADMLCQACKEKTFPELESRCYKCNKITPSNGVCTSCRSSSKLRRVWWLSAYSGAVKELVRVTKYGRKRQYARIFGQIFNETLPYLPEETVVVPIPTASARVRRRGFDQAEVIARSFAKQRGLVIKNALKRTSQVDQVGKRRSERIKQMKNSLSLVGGSNLTGKTVLLIDDVITTGATIEAAAEVLRNNGVLHVDGVVISRHLLS